MLTARTETPKRLKGPPMPDAKSRLTEAELDEIERMARTNIGEPCRGPLLALVDEVRRLRSGERRDDSSLRRRCRRA